MFSEVYNRNCYKQLFLLLHELLCTPLYFKYMKNNVSSYEVFNGSADREEDSRRGSIFENKGFSTTNNENKAYQTAERWYTLADEVEKLCISGITTHKWIEDESIASTHQLLIPCDSDLEDILQKDVIIENRECKLKVNAIIVVSTITLGNTKNTIKHKYIQLLLRKLI